MFILRTLLQGEEFNQILGKDYRIIHKPTTSCDDGGKSLFELHHEKTWPEQVKIDGAENSDYASRCAAFIISDLVIPLYIGNIYYIMTDFGSTFQKINLIQSPPPK